MLSSDQVSESSENQLISKIKTAEENIRNTAFKSLNVLEQIQFFQAKYQLGIDYYELSICSYKKGDLLSAIHQFKNAELMVDDTLLEWHGYPKDLEWCLKLADDDSAVQTHLGHMYYYGHGVTQDYIQAFKWWSLSAQNDCCIAQYNIGVMYLMGEGCTKNVDEGMKWLQRSAEQGYAEAQYYLGALFEDGDIISKNFTKAYYWYHLAAEQGVTKAQYYLGMLYFEGEGVEQNYHEGFKWLRIAGELGNTEAQKELGNLYYAGKTGIFRNSQGAFVTYGGFRKNNIF